MNEEPREGIRLLVGMKGKGTGNGITSLNGDWKKEPSMQKRHN